MTQTATYDHQTLSNLSFANDSAGPKGSAGFNPTGVEIGFMPPNVFSNVNYHLYLIISGRSSFESLPNTTV